MTKPKLIVLTGPIGSGKTFWANQPELGSFVYVNQDSQGKAGHLAEFELAVKSGKDVIVDRINFSKQQRAVYIDLAKLHDYDIDIKVFATPHDMCLNRALTRKNHPTIAEGDEKTAKRVLDFFFRRFERPTEAEGNIEWMYPSLGKSNCVVFDMDGTMACVDHRLKYVQGEGKKNWKKFFEEMVNDTPNEWCVDLAQRLGDSGLEIVLASGRPDDYRLQTEEWLEFHGVEYSHLFMRKAGDYRPDDIVKQIIYDFEIKPRYDVKLVIDDRPSVCRQWRSNNLVVLQCNDKEF
jgi:hypothetical protein